MMNEFNQKEKVTKMSYVNLKKPRFVRVASPVISVCVYTHTYITCIYIYSEIIEGTSIKTMPFIIDIWHQVYLMSPIFIF